MECSIPLLPDPLPFPSKKEPLLPTSSVLQSSTSLTLGSRSEDVDGNDVEMEVDDAGEEMEVGSLHFIYY